MAGRDGRYPNTKVGFEQNNNAGQTDRFFIDDDGFFNADGVDITGDQLRIALYVPNIVQRPVCSTVSTGIATSFANSQKNLISGVGLVIFSTRSNDTNDSFWLTSCVVGREVIMITREGSVTGQSGVIWVSTSGCSLIGKMGGAGISGFYLRGSATSQAYVKLRCYADNEWSVIDFNFGCAEA